MYPIQKMTQGSTFLYLFLIADAVSKNYSAPPLLFIPTTVLPPLLHLMHLFVRLGPPEVHNLSSDKNPNLDQ